MKDLSDAINERALIAFIYDGLERVAEPATLGYTPTEKLTLRGCLVRGRSRRNDLPCWELYTVSKIVDLRITGDRFADFALPGYTRGDSGFKEILAEH